MSLFPLVTFDTIPFEDANSLLTAWDLKKGVLHRGNSRGYSFALYEHGVPVAVVVHSYLATARAGGGLHHLNRETVWRFLGFVD